MFIMVCEREREREREKERDYDLFFLSLLFAGVRHFPHEG